MNREEYEAFLVGRLLSENGFGSTAALLAAIDAAEEISEESEWRRRKDAFNKIAELAPMRMDSAYVVTYEGMSDFLKSECDAFERATEEATVTG